MQTEEQYLSILKSKNLVPFKAFSKSERLVKRSIDLIGGTFGLMLFCIAFLLLFIPYHLDKGKDDGPMLYRQKRYGNEGHIFYIWKFRTMINGAEHYFDKHLDIGKVYHENGNKLEHDPRLTKIGGFIRHYSIDELPQFINVLHGEMSLVGPRPILLFEDVEYGNRLPYLLMCKPGITGYWTTHGRSKVLFPERADLELFYIQKHSTSFDLKLIGETIFQTIQGKDAF